MPTDRADLEIDFDVSVKFLLDVKIELHVVVTLDELTTSVTE